MPEEMEALTYEALDTMLFVLGAESKPQKIGKQHVGFK
jgi:hypothetical protein